ncbi:MAG: hypothetical protein E7325_02265 [Clostridiales bacterium]|nr:hypothetical protein [Clostridiales bacterium]
MAVMREITKRLVLEECLRVMEAIKLNMSRNGSGREALTGYEIAFIEQEMKCNVIREMIRQIEAGAVGDSLRRFAETNRQALEDPQVRSRIRTWQEKIMAGEGLDLEDLSQDEPWPDGEWPERIITGEENEHDPEV